jgi:para-nitrobenzyl esterase
MLKTVIIGPLLLTMIACSNNASITESEAVTGGRISGVAGMDASVMAFKGIPFAAPPVGQLRWSAPKPVVPWEGVRQASAFGNSCIQKIVQVLTYSTVGVPGHAQPQ